MTAPTEKHREAREIVARWKRDIGQVVKYERMETDIARALSARDAEIREVLEGLSWSLTLTTFNPTTEQFQNTEVRHWHDVDGCNAACGAAKSLWEKLQPVK